MKGKASENQTLKDEKLFLYSAVSKQMLAVVTVSQLRMLNLELLNSITTMCHQYTALQHDTTVSAMTNGLGVSNYKQPGYATAFAVELYSGSDGYNYMYIISAGNVHACVPEIYL